MINLSKILLGFHGVLIVYSIIGILCAGLRFGIHKSSYGIMEFEDLTEPELPDAPDSDSSTEFNNTYRSTISDISYNFTKTVDYLSDYHNDPQMFVLIPFITTFLLSIYFMAFRLYSEETYKKNSLVNCCVALWFIIFHYTLKVMETDAPEPYRQYFFAWISPALALNIILLLLLFAFIAVCGRYLRVSEVTWTCNALNVFTLDFIICFLRLIFSIASAISFDYSAGDGFFYHLSGSNCVKFSCALKKYPSASFFLTLPVLLVQIIFPVEHLLSLIWGKNCRLHDITAGISSGVSSLLLLFISLAISSEVNLSTFTSMHLELSLHLFHTWNIWANWRFISSCPKILNHVCRRGGSRQDEEATEGGATEGVENTNPAEDQDSASAIQKGRCFLVNGLIIGICFSCMVMSGISFDYKFWLQKDYYHLEAVLTAVLSACLIKALATTVTLINTGKTPPHDNLQILIELIIEGSVLIIGIVGTFFVPSEDNKADYSRIVASLSIAVLLIKIIESFKRSPVQMVLEMIAPVRIKRSSVPRQSLTPIVEEMEDAPPQPRGESTEQAQAV